jgi:hypothetical protein
MRTAELCLSGSTSVGTLRLGLSMFGDHCPWRCFRCFCHEEKRVKREVKKEGSRLAGRSDHSISYVLDYLV